MIDKLKSRLSRKEKGFTLIELLVVIAIIAILVLIVVVAINPAERLREASDRTAAANARSAGTLVEVCVTRSNGDLNLCDTVVLVQDPLGGDGNLPDNITWLTAGVAGARTNLCAAYRGRTSNGDGWFIYETATGTVNDPAVATATCT